MGTVTYQYGINQEEYMELTEHVYESLTLIKMLSPPDPEILEQKKVKLNRKTNFQKAIVFDLDETLAHCTHSDTKEKQDASEVFLDVPRKAGGFLKAGFNLRSDY